MSRLALGCSLLFLSLRMASHVHAQTPVDIRDLKLRDWEPRSMLVSRTTNVLKAKFPVVDVHNHLGGGKAMLAPERVARYLADRAGMLTGCASASSRPMTSTSTRPGVIIGRGSG